MATVNRQNPATPPAPDIARLLPGSAIIFLIYLAAFSLLDWMTSTFQIFPGVVAWYPPDGVSFAFLMAFGPAFIPAAAIASLISSLLIYKLPLSPIALIGWAILVSGSYGIAAAVLRRLRVDPQLRGLRDVLGLILAAAIVPALLAYISVSASVRDGTVPSAQQAAATFQWWIGETIGVLVVTPVLLIHVLPALQRIADGRMQLSGIGRLIARPPLKMALQSFSIAAALYLVFGLPSLDEFHPLYLIAIPIIWLALDYGLSGISLGILAVNFGSTFLIWALGMDEARLGELQLLMLVMSAVGLLLGAVRTERMQATAALRESEEHYRVLFETNPLPMWVYDIETHQFLAVNDAAIVHYGYTRDEFLDMTIRDIRPAEELPALLDTLERSRARAEKTGPWKHRRKDGTLLDVETQSNEIRFAGRRSRLVLAMDITERTLARAAQEQSQALFRVLFELSPEAILLIDPHDPEVLWPIIDCNQMACEMNGYSREELIGQSVDLINKTPGDREARNAALKQLREEGVRNREALHRRKDGTVFPIEYSSRLITVGGRELVIGIDRDITARKEAQQALIRSKEFAESIIQTANVIFVQLDGEGRVLRINAAAEEITGYTQAEVVGTNWFEHLVPRDRYPLVWEEFLRITRHGEYTRIFENPVLTKDGRERQILWRNNVIREGDEIVSTISFGIDITERMQAEAQLLVSESRYRSLFEDSPISLWDEDFSAVKQRLDELRSQGVTDFPSYFASHMEVVAECAALVRLFDVNKAALQLYHTDSKERLLGSLAEVVNQNMLNHFKDELANIAAGETHYTWEGPDRTLNGEPLEIRVSWSVVPGHEHDYSKVIVSVIDITQIKQAQERISRQLDHLAALSEIDRAITSSVGLEISLGTVLSYVIEQLGVDAADVLLLETSSLRLRFAAGRGFRTAAFSASAGVRLGEGYAGQAALERRVIHIPNLALRTDNPRLQKALPAESFVSYHGVPLIAKGTIVGVLEVFHRSPLQPDREWLDFLNTLANQAAIAIDNANLFNNLQHSNLELTVAYDATIEGWSHALDLRDKETEGHTQRVSSLAVRLAKAMGLAEETLVHVRRGALLHDIGKMGIPDQILQKPGALTEEEWVIMRRHPQLAFEMLSPIPYLKPALDIPYCHHEKWDGTGYPRKLIGEQIPINARIFAVVDVWDELTSDRPFRKAWSREKALEYIEAQRGKHFDPQVVDAFMRLKI